MKENPKQLGCKTLIDAVPQIGGDCPRDCGSKVGCECYGKGGKFWAPTDVPLMPTWKEAEGKIVRVNSYYDSNDNKGLVIETVRKAGWEHFFFNTCVPNFDFPIFVPRGPTADFGYRQAPVVYTCNGGAWNEWNFQASGYCYPYPDGREPDRLPPNVMYVRIRTNTWMVRSQDAMVGHYLEQDVPVVLTFLCYTDATYIPDEAKKDYGESVHVTHRYWRPTSLAMIEVVRRYKGTGVRMCGTPWSSACVDCLNCELLYWQCMERMKTCQSP